jgi:hypothetical protein
VEARAVVVVAVPAAGTPISGEGISGGVAGGGYVCAAAAPVRSTTSIAAQKRRLCIIALASRYLHNRSASPTVPVSGSRYQVQRPRF